jgi:hypothetical protein
MKSKRVILLITATFSIFLASCTCNHQRDLNVPDKEVAKDTMTVKIHRYEKALFNIPNGELAAQLKVLQPEYGIFLDGDLSDSSNIKQLQAYINDKYIRNNYEEVVKMFPDLKDLEGQLTQALKYFKFYFPGKSAPKVYTYVSGMDFELPIKYADSALIIALDMYLGKDYGFYQSCGLPLFKRAYMEKSYIARDCMEQIASYYVYTNPHDATLLDHMVKAGKILYFIDATLPQMADSVKIKYQTHQLKWCTDNESRIWAFFIDKKMLYSQNGQENMKLMIDGPFTSGFGKESAPRPAMWMGWQIVRAYMNENRDISIKSMLLEPDSKKILQLSKYKPKKP